MTNNATTCAYERCDCALTGELTFEHGGKRYCSERCCVEWSDLPLTLRR